MVKNALTLMRIGPDANGDQMRGENCHSIEMFKVLASRKSTRRQADILPRPTKLPFIAK